MAPYIAVIGIALTAVAAVWGILRIRKKRRTVPIEAKLSAAARERVYGEGRIKKFGDIAEEQLPKAERLWQRAETTLDDLKDAAGERGLQVMEEHLSMELTGLRERLFLNIDVTVPDPVFMVWTEHRETGRTSPIDRIKRLRELEDRIGGWIQKQKLF